MSDSKKTVKIAGNISLSPIATLIFSFVGMALLALWVYFFTTNNIELRQSRQEQDHVRISDYSCREVESKGTPIGVKKQYTFSVNEFLENDTCLAFYTVHQYVDVYMDGQLIYSLQPSANQKISKTVGSNWVMIPLYREDKGKEICVELTPVYESFRNRKVEFLIGSQLSIYLERLNKDFPQLILSVMAIFVGLVFFGIAAYNLLKKGRGEGLFALGLFSILMGLWRLTDTRFTPFIFPNRPILLFYISVTVQMVGVVPLIKSMEERFNKRSCLVFNICCIATSLISLIQLLLQVFGIMDLRENLWVVHVVIGVNILMIIANSIYDWKKYPENHQKKRARKLPLICVFGILADVFAFYIKGTSSGLLFSLLALFLYVVFMGSSMMFKYNEQERKLVEKDRLLVEQERKLTEQRIATMISQIRPHFIYNTLGTIGQFCLEDPQKAANLVQQFSLYLRGNFTELDHAAPIRISKELEHVQHYVSIEQVRFPDIQVKYDLKAGEFVLPALTVQPLVENAIKHGLMGLESGGCVEISTYETQDAFCVCVKDDGIGFDQNAFEDGKKHIGIKNIRERIEVVCGGTLTITSTPGVGTTARITIPKDGGK